MKTSQLFTRTNLLLLLGIFISGIMLSPKWSIAIFPWIYFTLLLRYFRNNSWIKATSNGLVAMIDNRGRILASYDYFDDDHEVKTLRYDLPARTSDTPFHVTSKIFISGLTLVLSIFTILILLRRFNLLAKYEAS